MITIYETIFPKNWSSLPNEREVAGSFYHAGYVYLEKNNLIKLLFSEIPKNRIPRISLDLNQ